MASYAIGVVVYIEADSAEAAYRKLLGKFSPSEGFESTDEWYADGEPMTEKEIETARDKVLLG